jgi:RNA polymerase sigma factor (sigma-70 family)
MDPATFHPDTREDAIMTWVPLVRRIAAGEYRRLGSLTKLLVIDVDDLFQSGVMGLILAVDHFDRELSAPQTYFTRRIRGAIYDFLRSFPYIQWNGNRVERADESELESRPSPCAEFARAEVHIDFERLVRRLSPQQRDVICGMAQEIPQNLIARRLGVTAGRVSQIKTESLAALRSAVGCNGHELMATDTGDTAEPNVSGWGDALIADNSGHPAAIEFDPARSGDVLIAAADGNATEPDAIYELSVR